MATTTTYNLKQKIEAINTSKNEIKSAIEDKIEACVGESYEILGNIQTYANEIGKIVTPNNQTLPTITENGTYEYNVDTYTGLDNVTVNVNQSVQDFTITENGTYNASEGYIGFGDVIVDVPPPSLMTKTINQSGEYLAENDEFYGYNKVIATLEGKYLVQVIDYDGTVLKRAYLNDGDTFVLPEEPNHNGLVFEEWCSPISITNNAISNISSDIIIGAIYTTASGLSEFDITLTTITGLSVTLNMNGTKNWGDGTTNNEITHTYSSIGNYTIICDGTTLLNTTNGVGIFNQTSSNKNYYVKNVRLTNISNITNYAFTDCLSLSSVTMSNDVESIGQNAFVQNSSLKSIVIPNSVTTINYRAFYLCSSLKNVVLSNVSTLGSTIFNGCSSLLLLYCPNNVTSIPDNFCLDCSSLKTVIIPNNITQIEYYAFNYCTSLERIVLSKNITYIDYSAFTHCNSLQSIKMPEKLSSIGSSAFTANSSIIEYDFTDCTSVPSLYNKNVFNGINATCKIKVPMDLYDEWITATNWVTYADYIVGV